MESKSREDFLAWASSKSSSKLTPKSMRIIQNSGRFASESLQKRWEAWQASRSELVVEEWDFDTFSPHDCGDDAVWMTEIKRTLGKVGITVKGEGDEKDNL